MFKRGVAGNVVVALMVITAAVLLANCGGGGGGSGSVFLPPSGMSQADAGIFAQQIAGASSGAMNSAKLSKPEASPTLGVQYNTLQAGCPPCPSSSIMTCMCDASCAITSCQYNVPIDFTLNCNSGGNIHETGSLTGSLNGSGTGTLLIGVTTTVTDWKCDGNNVINGDPYVSLAGHFSFTNGAPNQNQTMSMGGGLKTATQNCQINLTYNFNPSGGGDVSGTLCDQAVNQSF